MDDQRGVYIGMGQGERLVFPVLIVGVLVVPLCAVAFVNSISDVVRILILSETAIMFSLQITTITGGIFRAFRARTSTQPLVIKSLRWAHIARVLSSMILLGILTVGVLNRLGLNSLNWREPILQLVLILLAVAWGFMDRRLLWLERRIDTQEFQLLIQHLRALAYDRMEDEKRRSTRNSP